MRCMNRRLSLTIAGATAIVVTATGGAMAANVGILGSQPTEPAGRLTAANVVELSRPAPADGTVSVEAAPVVGSTTVPSTASPAPVVVTRPAPVSGAARPVAPAPAAETAASPASGAQGSAVTTTTVSPSVRQIDDDDDHDDDDHDDDHDDEDEDDDDD